MDNFLSEEAFEILGSIAGGIALLGMGYVLCIVFFSL